MADWNDIDISTLPSCLLFRGMPTERIIEILEDSSARLESRSRGELVRQQGDRYDALILLAAGRLEARFESVTGKAMVVEHFSAPAVVAAAVLMSSDPLLPVSLVAETDVSIITIPYGEILNLFSREPAILKAYLADSGDKVRFLAEKIRLLRFSSLRLKIASHLLDLCREQATDQPHWRYGREQMADLLGVARPSLSRELSKMADDGLLTVIDRNSMHLDLPALKDLQEDA